MGGRLTEVLKGADAVAVGLWPVTRRHQRMVLGGVVSILYSELQRAELRDAERHRGDQS